MTKAKTRHQIQYTKDAFEQDSGQAMKNDVVRGLIELITNSDDAYARLGKTGRIEITIRRWSEKDKPIEISVRDAATGLTPDKMVECFGVMGGDQSGFAQGQEVRGLFSRGSKDTAWFGQTQFQSIKDGVYSSLTVYADGTYETETSVKATGKIRTMLGIGKTENGLIATIFVKRPNSRVPELRVLKEKIASHVQLRDLVTRQTVIMSDYKDGKLIQEVPVVRETPKQTTVFSGEISIPSFACKADLEISVLAERIEGPVNEYSPHGIEVRGQRATYMNTMFGQSGTGTGKIHGTLRCAKIDELIRTFGQNDPLNEIRLVTRSRDGLESTHKFMQALTVAVVEKLKPILDELEPKVTETGSKSLRENLNRLGQLLAEEMRADLDDEDESQLDDLPTPGAPILVIPPRLSGRAGEKRTLTVLVYKDSPASKGLIAASSNPAVSSCGKPTKLIDHEIFPNIMICQVHLQLASLGTANIEVCAANDSLIRQSAMLIVHDNPNPDEVPPSTLEWKNEQMSVAAGKTRSLTLRAPIGLAPAGNLQVEIELEGTDLKLEVANLQLKLSPKGWLVGQAKVKGLQHSQKSSKITARGGSETAVGRIRVTVPTPLSGFSIEPKVIDEFRGVLRGTLEPRDSQLWLIIYAKHPGIAKYLGDRNSDGSYVNEEQPDTQAVLAEIMAAVAADHIIRVQAKRDPTRFPDVDQMIFNRTSLLVRYLRVLQQGLEIAKKTK
jgi:hypothetical protein